MKDYYDILEVPLTAAPEEIKAKYRQLVRVYHPDRFTNQDDKLFAEAKLKELNEAYAVLSSAVKNAERTAAPRQLPIPILEPTTLDFGVVPFAQRCVGRFQVGNAGGTAKQVSLSFGEGATWYTVTKGRQVYPDQPFPIEYEVIANTAPLTAGCQYGGVIEINMDGIQAALPVVVRVAAAATGSIARVSRLVVGVGLAVMLLVAIVVVMLMLPARPFGPASGASSVQSVEAAAVFAPTVETEVVNGSEAADAASDWSPVYSPDGQQIAFLSDQLGAVQVYLRDPTSGLLRQLTDSPAAKTQLTWSPDGKKLAFIAGDANNNVLGIVTVAEHTPLTLDLPSPTVGKIEHLLWSADSLAVVFDLVTPTQTSFYRANVTNGEVVIFTPPESWKSAWPTAWE